ncbi:Ku protein [Georgenia muralis]|uniref:Non-homologous end joining protein Ku n=1 Tax=Georgenia muralis TaxID=154117 RepID=A0A3N4Z710_9MICO|nr:Ku protein [Georgenia muralis]RPF29189.1 DNA end-binding protein Ku [Georgenia muralis]
MRAIWKGAITFGLVNVPVKLFSATESHDISLHQVHDADGGRIRYQRRCEKCGEVVPYSDIDKAYDDGDRTVVLTDEDLESLPVERSREIDVIEFVPSEQIDPIMMQSAYYLAPDSKSSKSYVLLLRTLEETERTAVVTFTLRQKTRLGALRVRDGVLVLQGLLWEDEVRAADFDIDDSVTLSSKEMEMSAALVSSFESDFDPGTFTDEYQVQLQQLIQAKLEQGEALDTEETFGAPAEEEGGEVLDLMEALRRSVAASRGKRAGGEDAAEEAADDEKDSAAEVDEEEGATGTEGRRSTSARTPAKGSAAKGSTTKGSSAKAPAKSSTARSGAAKTAAKSDARSGSTARSSGAKSSGARSGGSTSAKSGGSTSAKSGGSTSAGSSGAKSSGAKSGGSSGRTTKASSSRTGRSTETESKPRTTRAKTEKKSA